MIDKITELRKKIIEIFGDETGKENPDLEALFILLLIEQNLMELSLYLSKKNPVQKELASKAIINQN